MPIARFQLPDGRVARFEVAEGTTPEQAQVEIERQLSAVKPDEKAPDTAVTEAEQIAGSPVTRFALGAASPFLGAAQLVSESLGYKGVSEHLSRLEEMKRRGMSPAAELGQLKNSRATLAKMPGSQLAVAAIDKQIASLGEQPSAEPSTAGTDIAGMVGSVLSPAVLGAMKLPAAASVLGRTGQGAALGAGLGAVTPITGHGEDYSAIKATQIGMGGVIGGVIPPAIEGGRKVFQIGRNILDPILPGGAERSASRLLAEAAASKRPEIEAALSRKRVFVPGSQPTAAEAAAPAGSPEFSALQRIAREHKPTAFEDIRKLQETARRGAVRAIGKDEAAVEAAKAARAAGPGKQYEELGVQIIKQDRTLEIISNTPAFKAAAQRARDVAKNSAAVAEAEGKQGIPFEIKDESGNITAYSAKGLQYVKSVLDEMAESPTLRSQLGITGTEAGRIAGVKNTLVGWMNKNVPGWEKARLAYAAASKPINQMQVGQELEQALLKPIGEGERVGVFAGAMRDLPKTIKEATGKTFNIDEILEPENLQTVRNVLKDLARKAETERLATLGRGKAGQIVQPFGLPATGPLNQQYMIFKTILGRVSKGVTEKTLDQMSEALQLPSSTLKLLQRAPTAKQEQLINSIIATKIGRGAIATFATGSGEGVQK